MVSWNGKSRRGVGRVKRTVRFFKNSVIGFFLLGLTLGLFAYAGSIVYNALQERLELEPPGRRTVEQAYAVNVTIVERMTITPTITSFGEVRSLRTLELRAPASGAIVELSANFVEGGVVKSGEFILAVDPSNFKATLDLAISNQEDAEIQRNDAQRDLIIVREELAAAKRQQKLRQRSLERQESLRKRGVATDTAVEASELALATAEQAILTRKKNVAEAETRVEQAESRVRRQGISLSEAKRKLAETRLTAPFAGTLANVNLVEGRLVNQNERVAQLVDPDLIEVAFRVSNEQYSRIIGDSGQLRPLPVEVKGASLTARAKLMRESAVVAEGQTGRLLFAAVDEGRISGLRPGDFVEVLIKEPVVENVFKVPAEAVDSGGRLLIVGDGERLEERLATIVRNQGDEIILAARDLVGRMVVTQRTPVIGSGIRVKPVLPGEAEIPTEAQIVKLSKEERAKLIAFVEGNNRMPEMIKKQLLEQLNQEQVPQAMVDRLRARMGG